MELILAQESNMKRLKLVWKDNERFKSVVGSIESEDNFFITFKAHKTGVIFRLNKSYILSIKEIDIYG